MILKLSIVLEKDAEGYYAYCKELPGCQSQGDSKQAALKNIREAASLYVETLNEEERKKILRE